MTAEKVTYSAPWGDATKLPAELPNLRPVTEAEVARSLMFTYAPAAVGTVRVEDLPGMPKRFGGYYLKCFHMHDGTGMVLWGDWHAEKVRYFAYGCVHTYRELGMKECAERGLYHGGRCWHTNLCTTCGHVYSYDSSD